MVRRIVITDGSWAGDTLTYATRGSLPQVVAGLAAGSYVVTNTATSDPQDVEAPEYFTLELEDDPLDNDDDIEITTNGAGTLYWMISEAETATASEIISHTGAFEGTAYGTLDTTVGVNSLELPTLDGTTELWFHSVLCLTGTTTQASEPASTQAQTGATPTAAYVNRGSLSSTAGDSSLSGNFDLGTAAADRFVLVAGGTQGGSETAPTVLVNGVELDPLVERVDGSTRVGLYGALVPLGSGSLPASITWPSASYQNKGMEVWTLTGLGSTTPKQTENAGDLDATIPVEIGDLLFLASLCIASFTLGGTVTETPERVDTVDDPPGAYSMLTADWLIEANNAAFRSDAPTNLVVRLAMR